VLLAGCCVLAVLAVGAWPPTADVRTATANPLLAAARLQAPFTLACLVTAATRAGGQPLALLLLRTWYFAPSCAAGASAFVGVVAQRSHGSDGVRVTRRGAGTYAGQGICYAPLRCGGRTYLRVEAVPFTITVQVTATTVLMQLLLASRVNATSIHRSRRNLTPCLALPGHDAASYFGNLVSA